MATTTMHFGPEWMRKQPTSSSRPQQPDPQLIISPTPIAHINTTTVPPSGVSTYSALLTPSTTVSPDDRDVAHPFRYSRDEMIQIYREGGGRSGLGLEVERWEGIVREIGIDPISLKEPGEGEKKLFTGSLNSEMRRRQSTDYLTPLTTSGLERPKLNHAGSSVGTSPMRERFGALMGQRRRDNSEQSSLAAPRKASVSSLQPPLNSPRETGLPPPRNRTGPGFDGVLGSGESWVSRRRGSESKPPGAVAREPNGHMEKTSEIKEEVEETPKFDPNDGPLVPEQSSSTGLDTQRDPTTDNPSQRFDVGHGNIPNRFIDGTSPIVTNGPSATIALPEEPVMKGTSPGIPDTTDLASVEWSYVDIQGQVQGPFRADTMQTWHDQGYFTPDLLMKRTHVDSDWLSVAELNHRASSLKIFLSPLIIPPPPGPPGLSRRPDTSSDAFPQPRDTNAFVTPVPARSLRTTTLDPYINGSSNQSESPSSSFSAGRFGNDSPDLAAFGGRTGNPTFPTSESSLNTIGGRRRSAYADPSPDPTSGRSSFPNAGPARPVSFDDHTFNDPLADNVTGGSPSFGKPSFIRSPQEQASNASSPFLANEAGINSGVGGSFVNGPSSHNTHGHGQSFSVLPSIQYTQHHVVANLGQSASPLVPQPHQQQTYVPSGTSQSPWGTPDPLAAKRPGPFDPQHPTPRNTTMARLPSPWERTSRAPWPASQPEAPSDGWGDVEHSLTVSNLEQHNQQQQRPDSAISIEESAIPVAAESPSEEKPPQECVVEITSAPIVPDVPVMEAPTPKSRRKASQQVKPSQSPQTLKSPTPLLPPPALQQKAAWSKEDEAKKSRPSGVAIGFREIQEAEAKKAEARKVAERERDRATRATSVSPNDEASTFTASWGLPTSQVHTGRNITPKDPPSGTSPSATTSTAPLVWTSVAKPPVTKKTMKEIQEEEERRKKLEATKEKEPIGVAVRRAYAETMNKNSPVQTGPAWTTVGSSGKTAITASSARPPVISSTSALNVAPTTTPRQTNNTPMSSRPPPAPKLAAAMPKTDETPVNPSQDFLRWLGDSLKGLNSSVNLEDITSMLLSFPVDADPSTMEIISDLIYANSTTLDGRRFASEFVSKRKVDVTSRPKGAVAIGVSGKPPSIAEVVKAQPKPAQNEWGGFKVVNKKKKGGRS